MLNLTMTLNLNQRKHLLTLMLLFTNIEEKLTLLILNISYSLISNRKMLIPKCAVLGEMHWKFNTSVEHLEFRLVPRS